MWTGIALLLVIGLTAVTYGKLKLTAITWFVATVLMVIEVYRDSKES